MIGMGPGIGRQYASLELCQVFTAAQYQNLHDAVHAFGCREGTHLFCARPVVCDEL
jgi:hypothetical protein